jgi:hypothetical protein
MNFELQAKLLPNLFYRRLIESKEHYLYPTRPLSPGVDYFATPYTMAEDIYTNFTVKAVGQGTPPESSADIVGFLFKSNLPVANYSTAILSYARAWQQNSPKVSVIADELTLALKDDHFLMFHAPGKATLITSLSVSDSLHDYLTMI